MTPERGKSLWTFIFVGNFIVLEVGTRSAGGVYSVWASERMGLHVGITRELTTCDEGVVFQPCVTGLALHQAELLMFLNKGLGLGSAKACGTCRGRGGNGSKGQAKDVAKRHRDEFVWVSSRQD